MAWPPDFLTRMSQRTQEPRYLLEHVRIPVHKARPFGSGVRLSSFPVNLRYTAAISQEGSMFSGGTLALRDWACNPLVFNVGITGEAVGARGIRRLIRRGQAVVLKVGFTNEPADFVPVAIGTVYGVSRTGNGWTIRCRGLEGSLASRIAQVAGEQTLGWDLGSDTLSTGIGSLDTTIDIPDLTTFRRETGGTGAVLITDNDENQYYATFTGTSSGTGAGGSDQLTGVTLGAFGSAWAATNSGNAISEVMYVKGHPIQIARKVLTSTGTGTNGTFDTLPESWGLGIPVENIAERDMTRFTTITQPASGADDWDWVQPAEIENPQSALDTFLNDCGYFLSQYRGALTCRAVVEPWNDLTTGSFDLTDGMIVPGSIRYEAWNPDTPEEYTRTRILYADGGTAQTSATSDLDHIPARGVYEHTAQGVYSDTTNASAITADLVTRLKHWDQRVAEVLYLDAIGWWAGSASPGDTVNLNISAITSRTGKPFTNVRGLILRCAPDWFGSKTSMEIAILPSDETVPWRAIPA